MFADAFSLDACIMKAATADPSAHLRGLRRERRRAPAAARAARSVYLAATVLTRCYYSRLALAKEFVVVNREGLEHRVLLFVRVYSCVALKARSNHVDDLSRVGFINSWVLRFKPRQTARGIGGAHDAASFRAPLQITLQLLNSSSLLLPEKAADVLLAGHRRERLALL